MSSLSVNPAQPVKLGASVFNAQIGAATTVIVSAVANVNGVVIRTARVVCQTAGGSLSLNTPGGNALLWVLNVGDRDSLNYPVLIPAGQALQTTGSVAANGTTTLTYDIL